MSERSKPYAPATISQELGITVMADDVPRIVAALNRAYCFGMRDGSIFEREACAALAESQFRTGKPGLSVNLGVAAAIRARSKP